MYSFSYLKFSVTKMKFCLIQNIILKINYIVFQLHNLVCFSIKSILTVSQYPKCRPQGFPSTISADLRVFPVPSQCFLSATQCLLRFFLLYQGIFHCNMGKWKHQGQASFGNSYPSASAVNFFVPNRETSE